MTGVRAAGLGLLDGLRLPRADEVPSFEMDENPVPPTTKLSDLPANTPILLDNTTCIYCGVAVTVAR